MPTAFVCGTCGAELTTFLDEAGFDTLRREVGDDAVAPGRFIRATEAVPIASLYRITFASGGGEIIVIEAGDYLVQVADLRHRMSKRASFGCCGYEGGTEPNATCVNGHLVGTIHSDCWHPSVARLIAGRVEPVTV